MSKVIPGYETSDSYYVLKVIESKLCYLLVSKDRIKMKTLSVWEWRVWRELQVIGKWHSVEQKPPLSEQRIMEEGNVIGSAKTAWNTDVTFTDNIYMTVSPIRVTVSLSDPESRKPSELDASLKHYSE